VRCKSWRGGDWSDPKKRGVFPGGCGADGSDLERTTDGVIAINPQDESYLNLTETTQITLRVGAEFLTFALVNAAASLREGRLTVLAEKIRQVEPVAGRR